MRVAELTTYTSRLNGGVFYALSALLPAVSAISPEDEIRVFGYADPHTEDDRSSWRPLEVEAFAPWPPRLFGYSPGFYPALADYNPGLIHVHGLWTYLSMAALKAHRRNGTPVIISPHGMLDPWALGFSKLRKWAAAGLFQDRLLGAASVIHALNASEAAAIRAYGLSNPIVVIPNGVSLHEGQVGSPPWRPTGNDRILLFLSRVHPKKGLDMLINALPGVPDAGDRRRWRLVVAGWDEIGHEPELKALVAARGMQASVEFVGPLFGSAKDAALSHADAFALTSRSEGLPMAVLEAWSHGKPVLMTTACNLPEGEAAGASVTVEPTPAAVAHGLSTLAGLGDERRKAMGAAGLKLVEERFTWGRIASNMRRVYQSLESGGPLPLDLLYSDPEP